jgi:hypothetical protein
VDVHAGQGREGRFISLSRELKLEQFEATAQQKYMVVGQIHGYNITSIILF